MMSPEQAQLSAANPALDVQELIYRYVSLWNEHDPVLRRQRIEKLWVPDGAHFWRLGEERGYAALEARVIRSYDKWVAGGKYRFKPAAESVRQHNGIKFSWLMVSTRDESLEGRGCEVLLLAPDGRIQSDYQFPEAA